MELDRAGLEAIRHSDRCSAYFGHLGEKVSYRLRSRRPIPVGCYRRDLIFNVVLLGLQAGELIFFGQDLVVFLLRTQRSQ
jgi:hypothetical protein